MLATNHSRLCNSFNKYTNTRSLTHFTPNNAGDKLGKAIYDSKKIHNPLLNLHFQHEKGGMEELPAFAATDYSHLLSHDGVLDLDLTKS